MRKALQQRLRQDAVQALGGGTARQTAQFLHRLPRASGFCRLEIGGTAGG